MEDRNNLFLKLSYLFKQPPIIVFTIILLIVFFGPFLAPYDPLEPKPMNTLAAPSWDHWFGTDNFGYSGNKDLNPEKSNTYEVYSNLNFNKSFNLLIDNLNNNHNNGDYYYYTLIIFVLFISFPFD